MTTARGYLAEAILDFEATFGSDPASPAGRIMPVNTIGVQASRTLNQRATIRGNRNPTAPFRGNLSVNGGIQVPVDRTAFAYWLKAMFGPPATTGTGPYTHVFTPVDVQPSMVLEKKFTDPSSAIAYAKYNGCKVASMSLKTGGSADSELVADINIEGANETLGSSPYDATPTSISFNGFEHIDAAIAEGGSSLAIATDFDFTLDFGLDTNKYVIGGGGIRGDILEGLMKVSGNLSVLFQNQTLLDKAINETESSIVLTFTDGSYSLQFEFAEVQYGRNTPAIDGPQGILVQLPFEAYYQDDAEAAAVRVTLVNDADGTDY